MKMVTATEIKNRFGKYLELAREEPVAVHRSGRPAVVVISAKEYERLTSLEDQYWGKLAAAADNDFIGEEASEQLLHELLNAEN